MAKTPVPNTTLPKKAAPKRPVKPAGNDAHAVKLAAEKQRLASVSMLQAQNAVSAAINGTTDPENG